MFLFLFNSKCFDFNAIIWANACRYSFLTDLLYTFVYYTFFCWNWWNCLVCVWHACCFFVIIRFLFCLNTFILRSQNIKYFYCAKLLFCDHFWIFSLKYFAGRHFGRLSGCIGCFDRKLKLIFQIRHFRQLKLILYIISMVTTYVFAHKHTQHLA